MAAQLCEHCGRAYDDEEREVVCPHVYKCVCPAEGKNGHDIDCAKYEHQPFRRLNA